jgi:hypothetical protein
VIYFEDLILDPIAQCERLRSFLSLPEPDVDRLPTFEGLKAGTPEYGSGKYTHDGQLAEHWFRKGQVGSWKLEMPERLSDLFWHLHGETMDAMGYRLTEDRRIVSIPSLSTSRSVIIEGSKLADPFTDGIGRYVRATLETALRYPIRGLMVCVAVEGRVMDIVEALSVSPHSIPVNHGWRLMLKRLLKWLMPSIAYQWIARQWALRPRAGQIAEDHNGQDVVYDGLLLTLPQHYLKTYCWRCA